MSKTAVYTVLFLIAFFPDFIEYDDAAEEFHPFVKFFATFDPKVVFVFVFLITDSYYFYWLIFSLRSTLTGCLNVSFSRSPRS